MPMLSEKLSQAFDFALRYHQNQLWKDTSAPFLYHPLAVASLVLKFGGSEEQAMTALLHDSIAEGTVTQSELATRFGDEVARQVFGFADPELPEGSSPSWRETKQAYLKKLSELDEVNLLVMACEELHDGGELLHDLRYRGASVWKRYPVHGMEVFWYYRELLSIFTKRFSADRYRALLGEFASMVRQMKEIIFEGAVY